MASSLEQVSADLKVAQFVVLKLGETFNSFQLHSYSIFTLTEQWRTLQASFNDVYKSLEGRVKELESKDIENGVVANKLRSFEKEVELKRKSLELAEESLSGRIKEVGLRQNEVKKWLEVIEVEKRGVTERKKAVKVKERELVEGFERVKKVDEDEVRAKKVAEELECRKKGVDERLEAVKLRENRVDEQCKELELREREIKERVEVLEARETRMNEETRGMEANEKRLVKDRQVVELRERELDELYSLLELRENDINERFKGVESKVGEMNVHCEELKLKEKDVIERLDVLEVKEKGLRDGFRALEEKENEIKERFASLVEREEMVSKRSLDVEQKEMQVNAQCKLLVVSKEGVSLNNQWKMLELKGNEVDERCTELELIERETEELRKKQPEDASLVLQLKEKEVIECYLMQKQKEKQLSDEFPKALESKGQFKELSHVEESEENRLNEPPHAQELNEKQLNQLSQSSELRDEQINSSSEALESEEKKRDKHVVCYHGKEFDLKDKEINVASEVTELNRKQVNPHHGTQEYSAEQKNVCSNKLDAKGRKMADGTLNNQQNIETTKNGQKENITREPIHSQLDSLRVADAQISSSEKIPGDIHSLCRSMDDHGVRSYLLEHVKEYNVLNDKISDALRYALDPAKLVLSVCQISLTDRDSRPAADINNAISIFLLKQLMKLSPTISHEVSNEAKSFADFLKARLKGSSLPADHHRFLQFLASFKLANCYDPDELLSYFEVFYCGDEVYLPEENAYLCIALRLSKKIPGIIKSLIDQQKLLSAVKYICVFKLENSFPPVPLLAAHLESVNKTVDEKRKNGTFKDKIAAEHLESTTLKSILKCISNFKLESKLPPGRFISRIKELEMEKEKRMARKGAKKRRSSPSRPFIATSLQQEKRPRVETVQPSRHNFPVLLLPYPPGPPPTSYHSFGPTVFVPPTAPGHSTHTGTFPVGAPIPRHRAYTTINQQDRSASTNARQKRKLIMATKRARISNKSDNVLSTPTTPIVASRHAKSDHDVKLPNNNNRSSVEFRHQSSGNIRKKYTTNQRTRMP